MQHKPNQTASKQEVRETSDLLGIPRTGYLRLNQILRPDGPLPISKSAWWKSVREKRAPAPISLGPRTRAWLASDIIAYIEEMAKDERHG